MKIRDVETIPVFGGGRDWVFVRIHTDDVEQIVTSDHDVGRVTSKQITKLAGVRRPDTDAHRLRHCGELGEGHVGDQPSPSDDDEVPGREGHLGHQVRGHENRPSLGCQRFEQLAHP